MCTLTVREGSKSTNVQCDSGETLLSVLQRTEGLYLDAPCGGNGTCGKCRVELHGDVSDPGSTERSLLGAAALEGGTRLACVARVTGDCTVTLSGDARSANTPDERSSVAGATAGEPLVVIESVFVSEARLDDQRDSTKKLAAALNVEESHIPLSARERLASLSEPCDIQVAHSEARIIELLDASRPKAFAIAADIGTSTVVLYLIDLRTGEVVGSASEMNAQKSFGGDVISRIAHASKSPQTLRLLQRQIVQQITAMARSLAQAHGADSGDVLLLAAAGNTTMLHLLAGLSPERIAAAPFIPTFTDPLVLSSSQLGLELHPDAEVRFLPSVAAYVGADIVAGIVATGLDQSAEWNLLVDLGTNCEVVLGNRHRMAACATAAGPAFEGAQIECGVGGVRGAVRRVWLSDGLHLETIGNAPPVGICGSGILDTIALLVRLGIVDETGRMRSAEEVREQEPAASTLCDRLAPAASTDGTPRFLLAGTGGGNGRSSSSDAGSEVYFTQKDVREVQLAKAAIAAGIEILAQKLQIAVDDIARVYLSGAFGSSMSPQSACAVGMLPAALRDRAEAAGNTAGRGVVMAVGSREVYRRCEDVRRRVEYVELSSDPLFRDAYVEHMMFPQLSAGLDVVNSDTDGSV